MNNLLREANYFDENFDQNKFVFFPKQATLELSLNGTNVIQGNNPESIFIPNQPAIKTIYQIVNAEISFSSNSPSISVVFQTHYANLDYSPKPMDLNIVFQTYSINMLYAANLPFNENIMAEASFTIQIEV